MSDKSLYERLGGVFAIAAVVDHFSDAVVRNAVAGQGSDNPALREWHTPELARLPGLKFMRTLWVCDVAGGPFEYVGTRPGHDAISLEEAHRRLGITPEQFDAVAGELSNTLDFFGVRPGEVGGPRSLLCPQGRGDRIDGRGRLATRLPAHASATARAPARPLRSPWITASGEPRKSRARSPGTTRRCSGRDRRPALSTARPPRQGGSPSSASPRPQQVHLRRSRSASTSTCASTTDEAAQASYFAQVATEASAPGYGAIDRPEPRPSIVPPLNRIVSSAVPWIWRTATGIVGAHFAGFGRSLQAAIAAIMSACAHAIA